MALTISQDYLRGSRLAASNKVGHHVIPTIDAPGGPYGERLLPQIVDALASSNPTRVYASVPRTANVADGFRDVTMKDLANAINTVAWMLERTLGRSETFETIAYMGASDIRYAIVFLAAVKVGYVTLLPSARNSIQGNISLLHETKCSKVFYSADMATKVEEWKQGKPDVQLYPMESLKTLVSSTAEHYAYDKTFADAIQDPILLCHTSGSTGNPKPIWLPNGSFGVLDNHRKLPLVEGRTNMDYSLYTFDDNGRFICSFPPFHIAGMHSQVVMPIFYNATLVMFPPEQPATGEVVSKIMSQMKVRGIFCPPAVLEQLVRVPGGLEQAAGLDFAMYSGGPLAPFAGEKLSSVTDLGQVYGQTETGIIPSLLPLRSNWAYFEWNPAYKVDMQHQEDDVFEQVLQHAPDLSWIRTFQHTFPEMKTWRTKDLFNQHPNNANLWQYKGRTDDILVLSNGEKLNPVGMEGIIHGHPAVMGALIAGQRRFQVCLILEPKVHSADAEALIDEIWPAVEEANRFGPAHGRIFRSKIALSDPARPFVRAGKGTIVRQKTTDIYADAIEALYSTTRATSAKNMPSLDNPQDPEAMKQFLRSYIGSFLSAVANGDGTDFFVLGLDSLQTMEITNGLRAVLKPHLGPSYARLVNTKLIYENPNLESLTAALIRRLRGEMHSEEESAEADARRVARMEEIVVKYTHDLPRKTSSPASVAIARVGQVLAALNPLASSEIRSIGVVLTGSTGSLGTRLLQALVNDSRVNKIFCLNRAGDAETRHRKDIAARGVQMDLTHVEFHKAEFGAHQLGLTADTYNSIKASTDAIIHNAWKVDFNHTLDSFEDVHISGVRRLIDLSLSNARNATITFISSVASVGNWSACHPDQPHVPEMPMPSHNVAQKLGYGESKHSSEAILCETAARAGVSANILRVGQIAGPISRDGGMWNKGEWVGSMIQTSKTLGCLPNRVMEVDWIPVDVLADIILDIVHHRSGSGLEVYNLVNPHPVSWETLIPAVTAMYPEVKVVPLADWIERLSHADEDDADEVTSKPALKILEWFVDLEKGLSSTGPLQGYETSRGVAVSKTMAGLPPVSQEWMALWLKQWSF